MHSRGIANLVLTCLVLAGLFWLCAPPEPEAEADTFVGREWTTCHKANSFRPDCPPPPARAPICRSATSVPGHSLGPSLIVMATVSPGGWTVAWWSMAFVRTVCA